MAQWIKDPKLSHLWLWLLLHYGLDPWPGNFHMPWAQPPPPQKKKPSNHLLNYYVPGKVFCKNFLTYILKLLYDIQDSCYHLYPDKTENLNLE